MLLFKISKAIESFFLPIALVFSAMALIYPPSFTWIKPHIALGLGIIMFGMGLALDFRDFTGVLPRFKLVAAGVAMQYTVMPLLALLVGTVFGLPREIAIGLVIVGSCPGGTASNVITYLAKGNVALSVVMTLVSTSLAPILTPAIIYAMYSTKIDIHFWGMAESVFWIVVFPLFDGLILRRLFRKQLESIINIFPSISILAISAVIACVVGLNQKTIMAFPLLVILAVTIHNLAGFATGYGVARLFTRDKKDLIAISVEVGMQNSGLGVALAHKFFSAAAALPGALFSLEQNLAGICLTKLWPQRKRVGSPSASALDRNNGGAKRS